jgi:hypothetical protein
VKAAFAFTVLVAAVPCSRPGPLAAQAEDPAQAISGALPPDVARRVLAHIADAQVRGAPADVLTRRTLELSAKGVPPASIETAVVGEAVELEAARQVLAVGGHRDAANDEVDATATAMRRGVSGPQVSELAKSTPSGRSLAVPLFVIASLVDRGLPSDQALQRVLTRLEARASDQQLEGLAQSPGRGDRPSKLTGLDMAETRRSAEAGRPAWVPATDGKGNRPQNPGQQGQGKP